MTLPGRSCSFSGVLASPADSGNGKKNPEGTELRKLPCLGVCLGTGEGLDVESTME